MSGRFEADIDPQTGRPRIRLNFTNGWSASLVLLMPCGTNGCDFLLASLAACPTGQWGTGKTQLISGEVSADEAVAILSEIVMREPLA